MSDSTRLWYSVLEFRPDPSKPDEGRIPLAVIVECKIAEWWMVGLLARASLTGEDLSGLDAVGREILSHPVDVLKREVETVLFSGAARRPGEFLPLLAARGLWSIHVPAPRRMTVASGKMYPERLVDTRLKRLYATHIAPKELRTQGRSPSSGPPPWAVGPQTWELPVHAA